MTLLQIKSLDTKKLMIEVVKMLEMCTNTLNCTYNNNNQDSDITYLIQLKNGDLLTCCIDGTMKVIRLGKNEGYSVLQTIDTTKLEKENKNSIFSNSQLYVLLQIKSNENIVTVHGNNLLFFKQTKDNKDLYEFDYLLPIIIMSY